jgi:chemotaxis protein MotA
MDKTTLVGLILGIGAVLGGAVLDETAISSLVSIPAFLIVVVGTLGATTLSNPLENIIKLPVLLRCAFFDRGHHGPDLIEVFVRLSSKARKDGILSLEADIDGIDDRFLRKGLQLVVDGANEDVITEVLEADIAATEARHRAGYGMFDTMGGFAPTLGILGAVMGLIHVLSRVEDPTKLAAGIAVAFVATLYGVGSANLIFFPIGNKLHAKSDQEARMRRMMLHGVLSLLKSDNPRTVRDKLEVYLAPEQRSLQASPRADEAHEAATAAGMA